jgi:hypothetical protein
MPQASHNSRGEERGHVVLTVSMKWKAKASDSGVEMRRNLLLVMLNGPVVVSGER